MSKTNQDICHDFFYAGINGSFYRKPYKNVGYDNNTFYSYNTAIARIVCAHNGETVCLISYDNFSVATAKHLNHLKQACPITQLFVPAQYGCNTMNEKDVLLRFFAELNYAATRKLTRAEYREQFLNIFQHFQCFLNFFHDLLLTKEQEEQLARHKGLYDTLNSSDGVKKFKEKQRKEAARKAKELKELCKNNSITELAYKAYSSSLLSSDEKAKLRKRINPDGLSSYVWQEGDFFYRTSQNVLVTKKEGDVLLKLLHANKLKRGYQISRYTVVSVTSDHVKIGCHLIPRQNLEELYEQMLSKGKEVV